MDALEFMQKIENNSIDLILCDLPYGTSACSWDEIIPFESMWKEILRIAKEDCAMIFTASQPFTSKLIMSNIKMFKHEWIWEKQKASNFLSMKYSPAKYHENIVVFCKTTPKFNPIKWFVKDELIDKRKTRNSHYVRGDTHVGNLIRTRYIDDGSRYPKSVIFIRKATNGNVHPTQKPVELFEYLIKTYSKEGDLVMDCVVGSGTTALACKNTKRTFICNDNNLEYVKIAEERLSKLNSEGKFFSSQP